MTPGSARAVALCGVGQLGTCAMRHLVDAGARLRAADIAPAVDYVARFGRPDVALDPVDMTDPEGMRGWLARGEPVQTLVLLAGLTGPGAGRDPAGAYRLASAVCDALEAAIDESVERVVLASSLAVYGQADGPSCTEDTPTGPASEYGQNFLQIEERGRAVSQAIDVVALRIAGVYGPTRYGRGSHSARLIERLLYSAAMREPAVVEGTWQDQDDYVYVEDVGRAIAAAALGPIPNGFTPINIGRGRCATLEEVTFALAELFGPNVVSLREPHPARAPLQRAPLDVTRMADLLSVRSEYDMRTGIRHYARTVGLLAQS